MLDGDLTAVVSFIGVIVQLGGELLLVLLFTLLRRYVLRRSYFAAWTLAWLCGATAILALCARYIVMPRLTATPIDESSDAVRALYLVYQFGKLSAFALFVSGTATYVTGSRLLSSRVTVFAAAVVYSVTSLVWSGGDLNQLVVWQAPIAAVSPGACAALLFTLPQSRRTLGSTASAGAFFALALLWLVYGIAFCVIASGGSVPAWSAVAVRFNS